MGVPAAAVQVLAVAIATSQCAGAVEWHVSPTGAPDGNGSAERPWDLQTALLGGPNAAGDAQIKPGDALWLHAGTYRGGFESALEGTADRPIIVRQAPDERAAIDCMPRDDRDSGQFTIGGAHTWFWGFEITCSEPKRTTTITGSWPEDIRRGGVDVRGSHIKLINLAVHDTSGLGFWSSGEGGEIYGCLIYYNGWKGPDRGHGHAIYAQNRQGTKRLVDNIMFGQFGYGVHCYGSERAFLEGFHIEGNAIFHNGSLVHPEHRTPDILVGGGSPVRRLTLLDNFTYGGGVRLGYAQDVQNGDATVAGNHFVGGLAIRNFETLVVRDNTIVTDDQRRDATKLDPQPSLEQADPSGVQVFVRPNQYESGRGHVVVYNWDERPSVRVELARILAQDQSYRIVRAQDPFGESVTAGVFRGETIELPMRRAAAVKPIGMGDFELPIAEPRFGVFVVFPGK